MTLWRQMQFGCLIAATLFTACGPVSAPGVPAATPDKQPVAAAKKRVVAVEPHADITAVSALVASGARGRGAAPIVHAGFAMRGENGALNPELAENVPTGENGLWKVSPDGRME